MGAVDVLNVLNVLCCVREASCPEGRGKAPPKMQPATVYQRQGAVFWVTFGNICIYMASLEHYQTLLSRFASMLSMLLFIHIEVFTIKEMNSVSKY